jgi:signal transduction histidine kinase
VQDNGCGFDLNNSGAVGRGIRTMQSRALRLGAQLSITSDAGGTGIVVRLPVVRSAG